MPLLARPTPNRACISINLGPTKGAFTIKPTKSVGVHADWEFPNSEHAIGLVGPELVGLHILIVANGCRGGDLGPNHSLWCERIDFRVW